MSKLSEQRVREIILIEYSSYIHNLCKQELLTSSSSSDKSPCVYDTQEPQGEEIFLLIGI